MLSEVQGTRRKKRKALVQKASADAQEDESCQLNDVDDKNQELSFIPSAVSSSAG